MLATLPSVCMLLRNECSTAAGIGKATVERLAIEGATVAIFDINKPAGEKACSDFVSFGLKTYFYEVDVSIRASCLEAAKQFVESNGLDGIHYLVNCAAYLGKKGPLEAGKEDWDKSLGVNVIGYSNMVQACHPYMSKIIGDKAIVNVSSGSGHRAQRGHMTYSSTKAAIITMTKCMALDLSKDKIRVNSVSPAFVTTPAVQNINLSIGDRKEWDKNFGPEVVSRAIQKRRMARESRSLLMLRRLTQCSEQAAAICFLLSEDASCITGTDLPVDGGYLAMGPEGLGENTAFAGSDY